MRICSLLPSATEIVFALGLGDELVGVSHECEYPPSARQKPTVIHSTLHQEGPLSSLGIDRAVQASLRERRSLYQVDEALLHSLQPDLIITQALCDVCAIETVQVARLAHALPSRPAVLSLHPHTLSEALEDLRRIGDATGRRAQADALVRTLHQRLERVRTLVAKTTYRPRVFCLEWLEPPMASGHWVPEMVEVAGGQEVLGRAGVPSRYVTWPEIADARPEVLILMPCGFPIERTRQELSVVTAQPLWTSLPAVRAGRVYLANGPAYFNCSGPRLVDGVELLAGIFHPQQCGDLIACTGCQAW